MDAGNIKDGAKLIFIGSRVASIEDNGSGKSLQRFAMAYPNSGCKLTFRPGKNYGYRMSKIALNMAVKNLSLELAPRNIICGLLHPGMVKTGTYTSRPTEMQDHV